MKIDQIMRPVLDAISVNRGRHALELRKQLGGLLTARGFVLIPGRKPRVDFPDYFEIDDPGELGRLCEYGWSSVQIWASYQNKAVVQFSLNRSATMLVGFCIAFRHNKTEYATLTQACRSETAADHRILMSSKSLDGFMQRFNRWVQNT